MFNLTIHRSNSWIKLYCKLYLQLLRNYEYYKIQRQRAQKIQTSRFVLRCTSFHLRSTTTFTINGASLQALEIILTTPYGALQWPSRTNANRLAEHGLNKQAQAFTESSCTVGRSSSTLPATFTRRESPLCFLRFTCLSLIKSDLLERKRKRERERERERKKDEASDVDWIGSLHFGSIASDDRDRSHLCAPSSTSEIEIDST